MFRFGMFNLVSGALQLTVPSYGLRLVRRFGTQRVGWFLVIAFASLGLVHLVLPMDQVSLNQKWLTNPNIVSTLASVLLLIGMSHLDSLFGSRLLAKDEEERAVGKWKLELEKLRRANSELTQDVARFKGIEVALRQAEEQYRLLFAENPMPLWIVDLRDLRMLAVNKAALRLYGFTVEEFMALRPQDLLMPQAAAAFAQDLAKPCTGPQLRGTWQHRRVDQTPLQVEITAVDMRHGDIPARLILAQEITERYRREQQALETQRIEVIGRMAGGAAHHFNNILTIIDGHANLLLRDRKDSPGVEQLRHISKAANRAAALTRQLVAAGARQMLEPKPLNLNRLIGDNGQTLRRLIGEGIVLQESLFSNLPLILADPAAIQQVLMNLVLNAREAMPDGGTLLIGTSNVRIEPGHFSPVAKPGRFVCLTVADTGCGMSPEVQARVFELFFTTHKTGQRMGLGLASVYGIVKQHAGWVEFSSKPGVGTEFRVLLPVANTENGAKPGAPLPPSSRETILLVEPQERARGLARYFLSREGYRVIEADSAATALLLWERSAAQADLLLTDVALTGDLSGQALAERLRQSRPDLQVVYTSDAEERNADGNSAPGPEAGKMVPKPFNSDRLLQCIQASLAQRAAAGPRSGTA